MKHTVEDCSTTKFKGRIAKLHKAKTEDIDWLNSLEIPI